MAIMIPEQPIAVNATVNTLYQSLRHQLGSDYRISQYLDLSSSLNGTLLWIEHRQQSLFIYISDTSEEDLAIDKTNLREQSSEQLKRCQKKILRNPEVQTILNFKSKLLPEKFQSFHAQLVPFVIVFPQVPEEKLNIKLKPFGISLLGKEFLVDKDFETSLHKFIGSTYSKLIQQCIHASFSPEAQLFSDKSDNLKGLKNAELLDNEQEMAIKAELVSAEEIGRQSRIHLCGVNGGTKSGKSEVIIQRAKLLKQFNPSHKLLILTPNQTLKVALEKRCAQLSSENVDNTDDKSTAVFSLQLFSLQQWCKQQLELDEGITLKYEAELIGLIRASICTHLAENNTSLLVFLRELNFIQGRDIKDEYEYQNVRHTSQLNGLKHYDIWEAYQTFKYKLSINKLVLWSELPQMLYRQVQENKTIDQYDHILIDDAHHFSPVALSLVQQAIKADSGQLYLSQDPRQGITNPCSLWKETGLDLRGKSTRLLNSYEINPHILNAANAFYMHRLEDDTDKVIQFNFNAEKGFKKPQLLHFNESRDEENRLLNEIKTLVHNGTKPDDILLITMDTRSSTYLVELLNQTLDVDVFLVGESIDKKGGISICDLTQVQGQSAKYVFIFGIQQLLETEDASSKEFTGIDTEDYDHAVYIENTRKLNKAMTCAEKELTLFLTVDKIPDEFISSHIQLPTSNAKFNAEIHQLKG